MPISTIYQTLSRTLPSAHQRITTARFLYRIVHTFRHTFGKEDELTTRRKGITWHLNLREGIDFSIYLIGSFQPDAQSICHSILKGRSGATVLDIGANVGAFALPLARLVAEGGGVVYAFEPTQWAYHKLCRNLGSNPLLKPHLHAIQALLVDTESAELPENLHASWPLERDQEQHPVHLGALKETKGALPTTLDAFVSRHDIRRVDFIKLDVDGNEISVLNGAWKTIESFRPTLLMEWAASLHPVQALDKVGQQLLDLGYQIYPGSTSQPPLTNIAQLNALLPGGSAFDVLFVHHG